MNLSCRLTIIVPVGPEETRPPRLFDIDDQLPGGCERLVSLSHSPEFDLPPDWRSVTGTAGRGRQLNRAIEDARGHWLWLVHADSLPDRRALASIEAFTRHDEAAMAYFDLAFERDGPALSTLNAWGANLRSRLLGLPYGDQGYCLRRSDWLRFGAFRNELLRGEDLDFLVRARRGGLGLRRLSGRITTSARRYRDRGWLRTTWAHQTTAVRLIRDARHCSMHRADQD
jgi:hypothetical protein